MATNVIDLTDVAAVNAILLQQPTTDAAFIQSQITDYSRNILTRTSRGFLSGVRNYSERYNGSGSLEQALRNYPILAIASLSVDGIAIPASPDFIQSGYVIDTEGSQAFVGFATGGRGFRGSAADQSQWSVWPGSGGYGNAPPLGYAPYRFSQGIQNVAVSYTAGYTTLIPAEDQTVPASPGPYTVEVDEAATFYLDRGVTLASDGTPLTPVTGAPGPLQYTPPLFGQTPPGVYTFNAAQQAAAVNISYLYGAPPEDLSEAAARLVAQMYRKRSWIGQNSQIQPGIGTTGYSSLEVEIGTAMTIERYKNRMMP